MFIGFEARTWNLDLKKKIKKKSTRYCMRVLCVEHCVWNIVCGNLNDEDKFV